MSKNKWIINEKIEGYTFRTISEDDSYGEITDLLHRSYAALLRRGMRYWASHQDESVTRDRIEKGMGYVLVDDDEVIHGTVALYPPDLSVGCGWYDRADVAHFGQFGIDPELQGKGIGSRIMDLIEETVRRNGVAELALDTSVNADHLVKIYEKRGYRIVGRTRWDGTNYESYIMSLSL